MTSYIVGLRHKTRSKVLTIEAEDALIAALRAKYENPDALITYVRKSNRRGDYRHPHEGLLDRKPNEMSALPPKADVCGANGDVG
jgi:hypothetical protein